MKITRQRLKNIIMEEIALQVGMQEPVHVDIDNSEANPDGMAELGEGIEMITPDNIQLVADTIVQMGTSFLPGVVMAALAMKADDARKYLMARGKEQKAAEDAVESPETVQEEAEEGTLEELITQAIQEELTQMASKKQK